MTSDADRRQFLGCAASLAGVAATLRFAPPARAQPSGLATVRLSERSVAIVGPDATALATDGGDGVVLVGGGHEQWSDELLSAVDDHFSGRPIRALFNTHWHREQTGANLALGVQGVPIFAHENTRLWLGTDVRVTWSDRNYPALPMVARPAVGFDGSGSMRVGGREVEYVYQRNAHTDGDIGVYLRDENILVTGGHVSNDGWPIIDWWTGGWIGGMLDGFDTLLALANPDTIVVPANGPVMTHADLAAQQAMYLTIFDRLHELLRQASSTEEVLAARPTEEFDRQWGEPTLFLTLAFHSMWRHLRDAHDTRMRNIP